MAHVITSSYSGKVLEAFVTKAITGNDTVDKGLVYVKSGIKHQYTIPRLGLGKIIQDRKATPVSPTDAKGDFKFDERTLNPQDFMVYTEFNPRDLEKYWDWAASDGKLIFRKLDPAVQTAMVGEIMKAVNNYIGTAIWHGRKTGGTAVTGTPAGGYTVGDSSLDLNKFDGLLYRMVESVRNGAAGDKVVLAGNTAITSTTNVMTALNATFTAIPKALRGNPNLRMVMDYNVWDLYDQALIDLPNKGKDYSGTNTERFRGIKIEVVNGAPAGSIVAGIFGSNLQSNFWVGVDYVEDANSLQVEQLQANSELYFFKMLMKMDTNFAQPSEIVLHTPYVIV